MLADILLLERQSNKTMFEVNRPWANKNRLFQMSLLSSDQFTMNRAQKRFPITPEMTVRLKGTCSS